MKNFMKGLILATIFSSSLLLFSCEKNEVKPETFEMDPPINNTPQKPPNP